MARAPAAAIRRPARCASLPGGGFDYAGFADYWRASLEAYANAGIVPDYVSIQNNPNWVPPAEAPNEACRFLPEEGTTTVTVDGAPIDVAYPGYREALAAVRAAIAELPVMPRLGAPESGLIGVGEFVPALDASAFDALALHLYGMDATAVDVAALEARPRSRGAAGPPRVPDRDAGRRPATPPFSSTTRSPAGGRVRLPAERSRLADAPRGLPSRSCCLTDDGFEAAGPLLRAVAVCEEHRSRMGPRRRERATRRSSSARRGSPPTRARSRSCWSTPETEDARRRDRRPGRASLAAGSHGGHAHGLRRASSAPPRSASCPRPVSCACRVARS